MIDAAIINKKILLYVYDYEKYDENNGVNLKLLEDFPKITSKEGKTIMNIINKDKYDKKSFEKFKKLYTPQTKKTCTEETMDLIKRCLNEKN
jgi:CDP-glycerol glycerophosphotransferase (TagB/SpsB family)